MGNSPESLVGAGFVSAMQNIDSVSHAGSAVANLLEAFPGSQNAQFRIDTLYTYMTVPDGDSVDPFFARVEGSHLQLACARAMNREFSSLDNHGVALAWPKNLMQLGEAKIKKIAAQTREMAPTDPENRSEDQIARALYEAQIAARKNVLTTTLRKHAAETNGMDAIAGLEHDAEIRNNKLSFENAMKATVNSRSWDASLITLRTPLRAEDGSYARDAQWIVGALHNLGIYRVEVLTAAQAAAHDTYSKHFMPPTNEAAAEQAYVYVRGKDAGKVRDIIARIAESEAAYEAEHGGPPDLLVPGRPGALSATRVFPRHDRS